MKISLVGPVYPYRGGIAHFTSGLCMELSAGGHQVQMVSFKSQYPAWLYPGKSDKDPSQRHDQIAALFLLDPLLPWTWVSAAQRIKAFQPDLVIIQWWTTFWGPASLFLSSTLNSWGLNCFFCIHNVMPHEERLPDKWLSRAVLSKGKGCVTLSPKETHRLAELLPSARVFETHLPVPKKTPPALDRVSARRALGIPANQLVLLSFGIVRPYKGLQVLIDALNSLKEENITPTLMVVGEFWDDVQGYLDQIEKYGLSKQVIIENRYVADEELDKFFIAADVFAAPYMRGTQSAAIKMAMGYELPVIASDQISGDLPVETYPVYIHHAGDVPDLARCIRVFQQQDRRETRPLSGRENGWEEIIALLEKISTDFPSNTTTNR